MAANENEEFEFRARAEAEAGKSAPHEPTPADIPGGVPTSAQPDLTLKDKVLGPAEAIMSMGSGAIAAPVGATAGVLKNLTGGNFGTSAGLKEADKTAESVSNALTYQPRTEGGKQTVKAIGDIGEKSKLGGMGPAEGFALAGAAPAAAETGRAVLPTVANAAKKLNIGGISPEVAELARKAQGYGIQIPPDMLQNNKIVSMLGEAMRKVPLSGAPTEGNQIAFNKALIKLIGGEGERLTPDVFDKAMTKSGERIGEISAQTPIPMESIGPQVHQLTASIIKRETPDVSRVIMGYAEDIKDMAAKNGGVIPGETFRKLNSEIGAQARRTSNGDLKHALGEFQDAMHDALEANISSPELMKDLRDARAQYRIGKTLEPLVAKSETGDISGSSLMSAATSDKSKKAAMARGRGGDLGDLARIGQKFMKEPKSSGTAERGLAYGVLGGAGYMNPAAAAGVYGVANAYNRLGPRLSSRLVRPGEVSPETLSSLKAYTDGEK